MRHNKTNKKYENYRNAKLRHILERPPPDYPGTTPFYRGEVVQPDLIGGSVVASLFRSKTRIDAYMVVIGDKLFSMSCGMAEIHAELRRQCPPVMSQANF